MSELCPCGSGLAYAKCCGPLIDKGKPAKTAEALMRSRYTAYTLANVDHLRRTLRESDRGSFDPDAALDWARRADWKSLEIVSCEAGGESDAHGIVEFVAHYEVDGHEQAHHERASFAREHGDWVFLDGRVIGVDPYVREVPKVGRNEPCPCGSGKKFKKCCG